MAARLHKLSDHVVGSATAATAAVRLFVASTAAIGKSPIATEIEEIIALNPVVMFSKTTCPFCRKAKAAFEAIGYTSAAVVELDKLGADVASDIQDHLKELTGGRTVPRVFVQRKFIGGGTETASLADRGELKGLVTAAENAHRQELRGEGAFAVEKSDDAWRNELGEGRFEMLRRRGTEPPGSHEFDQFYPTAGHFTCAGCSLPLYSASSKFKSSCGWPVFDKCYHSQKHGCHVGTRPDGSGALEIFCPRCGSHLGHVFFDAHTAENLNGERH